jgi:cobalt/nickel transport system ATP-binding protein
VCARLEVNSAVKVENLEFSYNDGTPVLRNVSFHVEEGECLGLIGPNGAGKSTLLLHLNGILPEKKSGTQSVHIFGVPVDEKSLEMVRRTVGVLFQNPDDQLFCPTVYEDVAFGPQQFGMSKTEVDAAVGDSLAKVGLRGFERRSPHHLSRGEKQRVCLAGILVTQPKILVLDEPTSDLDPRGKRELIRLLKSFSATKIIASHDLELVYQLCSRIIVLDDGRVVAEGKTTDILSDEELMLVHGLEKPHILMHSHPHPPNRD